MYYIKKFCIDYSVFYHTILTGMEKRGGAILLAYGLVMDTPLEEYLWYDTTLRERACEGGDNVFYKEILYRL